MSEDINVSTAPRTLNDVAVELTSLYFAYKDKDDEFTKKDIQDAYSDFYTTASEAHNNQYNK